jgi:cytochrome b561
MRSTGIAFGRISRYAHWVIGILILILLPMGLFTSVLAPDHRERAVFLASYQTFGLTILLLVVRRMLR